MNQTSIEILLVAVNARYSHCAFAVRSLQANLGDLSASAHIFETDLNLTPLQLANQIVNLHPRIVGFSIYLWNVRLIENTVRILRAIAPKLKLIAGGPEMTVNYPHGSLFDMVIIGEGETAFRTLCVRLLRASASTPTTSPICTVPENPSTLMLPYHLYTDRDLSQRTIYVEASRGCPYPCGYCTSANTELRIIPLDQILPALEQLWHRGLRRFKFLDRSFNVPTLHAAALLDFFLARATSDMRLHFEINPDTLHISLATRIAAFPPGTLHLEAGIQTLNPLVAATIGRSTDTDSTLNNLRFLTQETGAIVHADLIFGLPGEDEDSFEQGFNKLITTCAPPEVQVNLLKGLPGTRFVRDSVKLGLVFNPEPPYETLRSDVMDFKTIMRIQRFARCWELVYNRNRFPSTVRALHKASNGSFYRSYLTLADRISADDGKLFAISLQRLSLHFRAHLVENNGISPLTADSLINADLNSKPS